MCTHSDTAITKAPLNVTFQGVERKELHVKTARSITKVIKTHVMMLVGLYDDLHYGNTLDF